MWYFYVLLSAEADYYYGCTSDLRRRMREHNSGKSVATRGKAWRLVYYEAYAAREDAFGREHQVKLHGQAKRQLKRRIERSVAKLSAG
jgi:putative endonuclease